MSSQQPRSRRKVRVGQVVSNQMDKSATVQVDRLVQHPKYKKVVRRRSRMMVHDEQNELQVGDKVRIMETRPLSKRKRWRLVEVMERAQ
jgi:small subunit ribosomal protein S17